MRLARISFWLAGAFALAVLAYSWGQLPDRVPSHFDAFGRPDAWGTRTGFCALFAALILGTAALFAGLGFALPRTPTGLINMPRKEYWLSPERRDASFARIRGALYWIGAATHALFAVLLWGTLQAALQASEAARLHPAAMWGGTIGYLVIVGGVCVHMTVSFRRPPEDRNSNHIA